MDINHYFSPCISSFYIGFSLIILTLFSILDSLPRCSVNTDFLFFSKSKSIKYLTLNFWALGKVLDSKLHCGWLGWITFKELSILGYTFPREEFESAQSRWVSTRLQDSGMESTGEENCSWALSVQRSSQLSSSFHQGCAVEGVLYFNNFSHSFQHASIF